MIKTRAMAIREINAGGEGSNLPYINSSNELVGTCSSLEMFFCPHGATVGASRTQIASAVGPYIFDNTNASISISATRMTANAATFGILGVTSPTDDLVIGTTDDILVIVSGEAHSSGADLEFTFSSGLGGSIGAKADNPAAAYSWSDNTPTSVSMLALGSATTASQTYTTYVKCDRSSATGLSRNCNQTTTASIQTPITANATSLSAQITIDDATGMTMRGAIAACGLFVFPAGTLPNNVDAMARWMGAQWAAGNYVLPYGW